MAANACLRTALIVVLALAGIQADRSAARMRFQRTFPLDALGSDEAVEARKQFEFDIVRELSELLGLTDRLELHSVNVQDRVVKVAIMDSAYGIRAETIVEDLNRHRKNHESPLWTKSLTSHIDDAYPIKLSKVEDGLLSKWIKRSSVVYSPPTATRFEDEEMEDGDKKYGLSQDLALDTLDFIFRQLGYSIKIMSSQFVDAFWEFSLYGQIGTIISVFFVLITLGGSCYQFFREVVEIQEDGIRVRPNSGRKGPGRGSPYKEEIKYYTPQSAEKKPLRRRHFREGVPPRRLGFGDIHE